MTNKLTTEQRTLLQRYYDEEVSSSEVERVQTLLNESQPARVFMAALEELTEAMRATEDWTWGESNAPPAEILAQAAFEASSLSAAPLTDLVPLLERFWDGEVVAEEMAAVSALMQERDDVADYLARLEEVRDSVRVTHETATEDVDFGGFWDAIESRIEAEDTVFDAEEHRVLLYRYHDGEASASEAATVEAWREAGVPEVTASLEALRELGLAATVASETAQERVDFGGFWHAIEDGIDDAIESQGENVRSLQRARRERGGVLSDYRQGLFAAVATMLAVAFVAGLFKDQLFTPAERVIVEKTVVIVDSIEYQPGSSVMVNSPMQPVSATIESATDGEGAADEEPTVIWLIDSGPEAADAPQGGDEESPAPELNEEQPI